MYIVCMLFPHHIYYLYTYLFVFLVARILYNLFKAALDTYEMQSKQLADKALSVASTYTPVMERLAELLGNLDALSSLARVVLSAPCNFCRASTDPECKNFKIQGATHVLVYRHIAIANRE